jgi:hypothetical protein
MTQPTYRTAELAASARSYQTSDYGQAAFLLARGFPIKSTIPKATEVAFQFDSSESLLNALSDYSSNVAIPCRDYFHALRRTKALIHQNTEDTNDRRRPARR